MHKALSVEWQAFAFLMREGDERKNQGGKRKYDGENKGFTVSVRFSASAHFVHKKTCQA
jgi:hypothetical protein